MRKFDDSAANILRRGDLHLSQTTPSILSLNEAWLHTLDRCVPDTPLSEVILPLMRNCFLPERCMRFFCCEKVMVMS